MAIAQDQKTPSITVTGEGEVMVKPDLAEVVVGVVTQDKSAGEAMAANNQAMNNLVGALKQRGIDAKDIQTQTLHLSPRYEQPGPRDRSMKLVGFDATNQVSVKVRDLSNIGKLLDDVVTAGANRISGISFTVSEPARQREEARRKAVSDARGTAELLAGQAGVRLGKVLEINDEAAGQPPGPMPRFMAMEASSAVPIEAGEQAVRARVRVTYALQQD